MKYIFCLTLITINSLYAMESLNKDLEKIIFYNFFCKPNAENDLSDLYSLSLSKCNIKDLESHIPMLGLKKLSFLLLTHKKNNLSELFRHPTNVELKSRIVLQHLDLSDNKLTKIPPEIGQCTDLESLNLDNNYLRLLPRQIGSLKNLIQLTVQKNKLRYLPDEIGKLTNLTALNVSENQLNLLPLTTATLKNLRTVNLQKNNSLIVKATQELLAQLPFVQCYLDNDQINRINSNDQLKNLELTH